MASAKKPRRVFRLARRKRNQNPCFAGACTSQNTRLSLPVCERLTQASARSRLPSLLSAKPIGFVDSLTSPTARRGMFLARCTKKAIRCTDILFQNSIKKSFDLLLHFFALEIMDIVSAIKENNLSLILLCKFFLDRNPKVSNFCSI